METPTPFDEVYSIIDALTLEYHRLITKNWSPGKHSSLFASLSLAKNATLRAHGWSNSAFQAECMRTAAKYVKLAEASQERSKENEEQHGGTFGLSRSDYRRFGNHGR